MQNNNKILLTSGELILFFHLWSNCILFEPTKMDYYHFKLDFVTNQPSVSFFIWKRKYYRWNLWIFNGMTCFDNKCLMRCYRQAVNYIKGYILLWKATQISVNLKPGIHLQHDKINWFLHLKLSTTSYMRLFLSLVFYAISTRLLYHRII